MKGTHDHENAQTLSATPAGVLLAQIAAPFIAAGMEEHKALHKAYFLTITADDFIVRLEMDSLKRDTRDMTTVGIDGALEYVGLKSSRVRFRELLIQTQGQEAADELWRRAVAGERVFTPEIWGSVKAARKTALVDRNRKAVAQRSERQWKKNRPHKQ